MLSNVIEWKTTTLLVCLYGVIKEFRPATPFLTPFLVSEYKNFTVETVYSDIYPFWTYSYLLFLVPILILTDAVRYKPLIIAEAVSLSATWALLVWGHSLRSMQLMQIIFGLASAAEIAFSSYLYAVVDVKHYRRVASLIKTSVLIGKLLAFALAQALVSYDLGSFLLLNQITFAAVTFVVIIAILLPNPQRKTKAVIKDVEESSATLKSQTDENLETPARDRCGHLVDQCKIFATNATVFKWSLWWAFLSCAMFQVYNYVQALWIEIDSQSKAENGLIEFINTLLGAFISFSVQYIHMKDGVVGDCFMLASALLMAISCYVLSVTSSLWTAYGMYIVLVFIYHAICPITSAMIASMLKNSGYGFVFGANSLVALVIQTALTVVFVDRNFFGFSIQSQFCVYAAVFFITALLCVVFLVSTLRKRMINNSNEA